MLPQAVASANLAAVALGVLSLSFCLFTPDRVKKYLPGSLLALVTGTLAALVLKLGQSQVTCSGVLPSKIHQAPAVLWLLPCTCSA